MENHRVQSYLGRHRPTVRVPVSSGQIDEPTTFNTIAACEEHIASHSDRMKDWVRGVLRADWSLEVQVKGSCSSGQSAGTEAN